MITDGQTDAQMLLAGIRFSGAGALLVTLEGLLGHQPHRYTGKAFCCMAEFGLIQTSVQCALFHFFHELDFWWKGFDGKYQIGRAHV